jgi:hypothetical protein
MSKNSISDFHAYFGAHVQEDFLEIITKQLLQQDKKLTANFSRSYLKDVELNPDVLVGIRVPELRICLAIRHQRENNVLNKKEL